MSHPQELPLVDPQALGSTQPFAPGLADLLDRLSRAAASPGPALRAELESALEIASRAGDDEAPAASRRHHAFDEYFSIQPIAGRSWRHGVLRGTLTAYLRWLDDSAQGTTLAPADWRLLASGLFRIVELLQLGAPGRRSAEGEPPAPSLPALAPPRGGAVEVDAMRRWVSGHWLFAVLINAEILALEVFRQDHHARRLAEAGRRLQDAAHVLGLCAVAMRYAGDFRPEDYEAVIRPSMPPEFSGLMFSNHAYMIGKMASLRPVFSALPAELREAHDEYAASLGAMYDNHHLVCERFVQERPSLRCPERRALDTLALFKKLRHDLVRRPAEAELPAGEPRPAASATPPAAHRLELPTCDDRPIWDAWLSGLYLPSLTVADEIGLFEHLSDSPSTADAVATRFGLEPRSAEALLGLMKALGFLAQRSGRFHITDVTRNFLLPSSPYYWGGMLHPHRSEPFTHAQVKAALLGGAARPDVAPDEPLPIEEWSSGDVDPRRAASITAEMHSHSLPAAMGVARWGDFQGVERLLDVGGGSGCFCITLALRHPALLFGLLDLPGVCSAARGYIDQYGLADRIRTHGLDMFEDPWPDGYDAVLLSNVLHDWDRATCLRLLERSFRALPRGGRIYLHEMLLDDTRDAPLTAVSFSMLMAVRTRGKQFTHGELTSMLTAAGFTDVDVVSTYGYHSLVSARRA